MAAMTKIMLALAAAGRPLFARSIFSRAAARSSRLATSVLTNPTAPHDAHLPTSTPIYQTATFGMPLEGPTNAYDYTRSGNPTRAALEATVAGVERGATHAYAFTTGMGALTAVLRACTRPGDTVVATQDLYGGTHRLLSHAARQQQTRVKFADLSGERAIWDAIAPGTKLVMLESLSNPLAQAVDLRAIVQQAHRVGALVCVDNSILSPVLMSPLELGADIVVHSATKFLAGHSDTMAGVVAVNNAEVAAQLAFLQNAEGTGLAPFDAWLVARGLKTLPLRQAQSQKSAAIIYDFLQGHSCVEAVHYMHPDRVAAGDAQAQLHFSQAAGAGSVLSFVPKGNCTDFARRLLESTRLFKTTVSFGSVHSSIEMPCLHSHASIPAEERTLPASLVRISVGTESVADLLADLANAMRVAARESEQLSQLNRLRTYELGIPLPPTELQHACGACMPTWRDVVGYEEGDEMVHKALRAGYPRFVYPQPVKDLIELLTARVLPAAHPAPSPAYTCLPVASAAVGLRLARFVRQVAASAGDLQADVQVHDVAVCGVHVVTLTEDLAGIAKLYWQHTGELVSSRLALEVIQTLRARDAATASAGVSVSASAETTTTTTLARKHAAAARTRAALQVREIGAYAHEQLRERVGSLSGAGAENVSLHPSGMASITRCNRLIQQAMLGGDVAAQPAAARAPGKYIVYGFPYLDTLKQLQHPQLSPGAHFVRAGDLARVEEIMAAEPIVAVFCEVPANPLLTTPDVQRLRALADRHDALLVADDSIGNFCNTSVLGPGGADLLVSSLTKIFSGGGNVMGGSLCINPESRHYERLAMFAGADEPSLLHHEDARKLLANAADLEARNAQVNATAEHLADFLHAHPAVKELHYPKFVTRDLYHACARPDANDRVGYGGLMSIVLADEAQAEPFFDALAVPKGPGFGTNFSLAAPYTLLAHYNELDWVRSMGVDPSLVRMWVGIDAPASELIDVFDAALDSSSASLQSGGSLQ